MTDLVELTAALVDIPSVSRQEQQLVAWLEVELAGLPWLTIDRVGDNLVARTELGREHRILLGGHTDTVPPNGNETARVDGATVHGLGAADMKGGLAVMLRLAREFDAPSVDVTYLFYAREEIALAENGLRELFAARADLLEADAAVLGEPTGGALEAGCQGTMRFELTLAGERAHTARPWMGCNAIHRLGAVLERLSRYAHREPEIDGCRYREALQAVSVAGGVAGNVVPDEATLLINHRFAPDRTAEEAEAHVRAVLADLLTDEDHLDVVDVAAGAAPGLEHPLLRAMIDRNRLDVVAKLGWTDVAFFAQQGIPACNLGPGEATLAHTAAERVESEALDRVYAILADLMGNGV